MGQRKGIGVPSNTDHERFVVTGKDETKNQLIVAFDRPEESTLWSNKYGLKKVRFIASQFDKNQEMDLLGKARYRDPSTPIKLFPSKNNEWVVEFKHPQRALTPTRFWRFIMVNNWWAQAFIHIPIWAGLPFPLDLVMLAYHK